MGKIKKIKEERKRARIEQEIKRAKTRKLIFKLAGLGLIFALIFTGGVLGYKFADARWGTGANIKNYVVSVKERFIKDKTESEASVERKTYTEAPAMRIDVNKKYTARMETTKGTIEFELDAKETPKTVNNFVVLSTDGFYNNTVFHRIISDFMIQGGDPEGTGAGDPGYKFEDEKFTADYTPGTLAMANSGANTNGSQFFVMTGDYSGGKLPKNYTIFGRVISGMDIVSAIANTPVEDNGRGEQSKPTEEVKILTITINEE